MDSNQTIQLKPMYPHSHINLCNSPVINGAIPGLSLSDLAPGSLHMVESSTNGSIIATTTTQESNNNSNTLHQPATADVKSMTQIIPVTTGSVCLNNIQLQMHPQAFSNNQVPIQAGRYLTSNGQPKGNQMLQIHITSPLIQVATTTPSNGADESLQDHRNRAQSINGANLVSDSSGDESSKSTASLLSHNNSNTNARALGSQVSPSKQSDHRGSSDYVDLARASCSSGSSSAISMRVGSTDSDFANAKLSSSSRSKGFKCHVCDRDFTQKGNLKTHMMTHSGERPYECQTCGKNFTQKGNLDTHVKIHTETKDHKCQYCDRGFTQRGNLKTHIRSIHTKEKPYACGHCGKAFSQKGNMLTHYRTHDKEARFPCDVCGKTFSQKGNLKTHQQRHSRSSTS